jgi:hypothetical protein
MRKKGGGCVFLGRSRRKEEGGITKIKTDSSLGKEK